MYLSVDMEGITGLVDETFVHAAGRHYTRGQALMTEDANHVIEAAWRSGCEDILVNDSHSKMNNLLIEKLHPEARLISGDVKPFSMMQGLDDSFTGALFVGYHARAAEKGVLSHTMTPGVREVYINETWVGEFGLNAYLAGHYGVPVLMVSGDDAIAAEAKQLIPTITTAVVKEQVSRTAALCFPPQKSAELLQEKTHEALTNRSYVPPLIPPESPLLSVTFADYGQAEWANLLPGSKMQPGATVTYRAKDMSEAYRAFIVMTELSLKAA